MNRLDSIQDTLAEINIEWTTSDYFIMPDMTLPEYPEGKELHFGYYVIFICIAGNIELYINDVPETITPFCLYAFNPETIVKPKSKSDDCVLRVLLFTKDFLLKNNFKSDALNDFKFFTDSKYNKIIPSREEVTSLLQLYDLLNAKKDNSHSAYYLEIIRSIFYTFLYEAQAVYSKDVTGAEFSSKRERDLNNKFNELIKVQAITQHNLKFYADALFITPKYLISAIKNASGKTPGVLINETIIEEAKQFLAHTDLPVVEISDRLQFNDIATFSKFFKRYTALSPSAFRKKLQQ